MRSRAKTIRKWWRLVTMTDSGGFIVFRLRTEAEALAAGELFDHAGWLWDVEEESAPDHLATVADIRRQMDGEYQLAPTKPGR